MRAPTAATPTAAFAAVVRAALLGGSLATLFATPAVAVEGPWQENPQSRVRLISPYAEAPAAGPWQLGLEFATQPGWHVYWKNSGDAGYPPVIDFAATPGAGEVEIRWPAPERYLFPGDLEALGYEGEVIYPLTLAIEPAGGTGAVTAGETVTLAADLDYLVCEVDCIPYRYQLTLAQPVAPAGGEAVVDPAALRRLARWQARLPRAAAEAGVTTEAAVDLSAAEPVLEVRVRGARAARGAAPDLFLEADDRFDFAIPRRVEAAGEAILFRVAAPFWQVPDPMPAAVELAWTVTGLGGGEGGAPLAVEARQAVSVGRGGLPPLPQGGGRPPLPRLLAILAGALAGGLLLHLTPTLLPLAVVRGMEIAAEGDLAAAARRAALATAAGAFAGALVLGGGAVALRGAGQAVTWGTQLQEPTLVALLALAATLLALGLWGLFGWPLRLTGAAATLPPERRAAALARGAAVGLAAALLALPWTLPPLPESIGPALAAGPAVGLLAFAALGAGLALPWLAVAAAPRLVGRLPRPAVGGAVPASARRLAEGLGFLAAGAVVWLLYLLSRQLRSDGLALLELVLLTLALVAWVRATAHRRLLAAALAVVVAGLAVAAVWVADARRLVPRATGDRPAIDAGVRPTVNAGAAPAVAAAARPASAPSDHSSP
jgi:suppressor for copper-sensitivity B